MKRGSAIAMIPSLVIAAATAGAALSPDRHSDRATRGASHYVAPSGTPTGNGSRDRPWDLAAALRGAGGKIHPGDTVWLRGGRYAGDSFTTHLEGRPDARITFRQSRGERATIDGRLLARGSYLDFWGFEIMQSDPLAHPNVQLLDARTNHGRFINLVLHDANTHGVNFWTPGVDAELYGCIVYNNGTHENLDHGVYVHNESGTKLVTDNVFFNNYARGIQVYASHRNQALRNVRVVGNVAFNNGTISRRSTRVNLLFNAKVPIGGMVAEGNLLYFSGGAGGTNVRLAYLSEAHNRDVVLRENYAVGGERGLVMEKPWQQATVENNTIVGYSSTEALVTAGTSLGTKYRFAGNSYYRDPRASAWRHESSSYDFDGWRAKTGLGATDRATAAAPRETKVFVRPNKYEAGRANIAIYNWARQATVPVDVSDVVKVGDWYEVRNVQDVFGAPVVSGVYGGGAIGVPMTGVAPSKPIGRTPPKTAPRTGPDFDVFVITSSR